MTVKISEVISKTEETLDGSSTEKLHILPALNASSADNHLLTNFDQPHRFTSQTPPP